LSPAQTDCCDCDRSPRPANLLDGVLDVAQRFVAPPVPVVVGDPAGAHLAVAVDEKQRALGHALEAVVLVVEHVVVLRDALGRITQQRDGDAVFVDELLVRVRAVRREPPHCDVLHHLEDVQVVQFTHLLRADRREVVHVEAQHHEVGSPQLFAQREFPDPEVVDALEGEIGRRLSDLNHGRPFD